MTFDDSNIVGNFEYPLSTDRQPSTNRITIKYVDSPAGFEARELRINDYAHQAQVHKVNNQDLDGSAIDSYFQAWRIGQWARGKARDLGRFCSFDADIKATLIEVGDVIAVSAGEVGLAAVPFRVIEVGFNENDEVSLVGQLYSSAIYDDQAPQTTVSVPTIFSSVTGESTATVTLNPPANTDTHLPLGNLVVNVVANSAAHGPVLIYLPAEVSDSGNTVTVKWMAGNTQDVHVVEASGDTIDGLSTPVVLNAENPIWTGVAS
jgi:hypothetical protein